MTVTRATVVRYRTKPEHADENAELVRAVYDELAESAPDGFRYATFRLDDGVTFVHLALLDGVANPLVASPAFGRFQSGVAERCENGPVVMGATVVGDYGLLDGRDA